MSIEPYIAEASHVHTFWSTEPTKYQAVCTTASSQRVV